MVPSLLIQNKSCMWVWPPLTPLILFHFLLLSSSFTSLVTMWVLLFCRGTTPDPNIGPHMYLLFPLQKMFFSQISTQFTPAPPLGLSSNVLFSNDALSGYPKNGNDKKTFLYPIPALFFPITILHTFCLFLVNYPASSFFVCFVHCCISSNTSVSDIGTQKIFVE